MNWKTSHRALCPVIVEIAYAKFFKEYKKLETANLIINDAEHNLTKMVIARMEEDEGTKFDDEEKTSRHVFKCSK